MRKRRDVGIAPYKGGVRCKRRAEVVAPYRVRRETVQRAGRVSGPYNGAPETGTCRDVGIAAHGEIWQCGATGAPGSSRPTRVRRIPANAARYSGCDVSVSAQAETNSRAASITRLEF
jgi:hypothetical protein